MKYETEGTGIKMEGDLLNTSKRADFVYRPPESSNLSNFFIEIERSLDLAFKTYDNVVVMGDINIDCDDSISTGFDSFTTFCETYNLKNLIKQKICFTNTRASRIDVFLTNKHACFHNSKSFETGLSDHHHMISTFMKTFLIQMKVMRTEIVLKFRNIIDKHAPIKIKLVRGNEAPFMKKNYENQFTQDLVLKTILTKIELIKIGQNIKNKEISKSSNEIMIIHDDIIVTNENELAEIFNEEYIHIVENTVELNQCRYEIINLKIEMKLSQRFWKHIKITLEVSENEVSKLFGDLKVGVASGEDKITAKMVKLAKPYLIKPLTNAINNSICLSVFSRRAKRATVSPIDKGGKDKLCVNNYRPVSILNIFSKFYERIIKSQIVDYIDKKLSEFLSAYRESYGTQHVLIRLLEEWKQKLDKHYVVGAVLMDLSKVFDCVPHDLLIAKLNAYGFSQDALLLILSDKCNNCDLVVKIGDKLIKTESEVKLLGVTIDNGLNFDSHISKLIKKSSAQLNALFRLSTFLSHKAKLALVQSFIYSNFNYCPLVWNFSSYKSLLRIEQIQKRAFRFLLNDNDSTYDELLLKAGKYQMSVYGLKTLCTEIYKTLHELNPTYIKDIFKFHGSDRPVTKC
ncbi:uncharacterized protein LOC130622373 [Hydractinia symbiolongicarpus]|uniref:uncharacterized protein LOC130622373 n=1 Tax=Hydractinia symbiolongicarpus TaxID=13093 RepID=UPI00254F8618|nr:uncharacterized protein LOC130622373 [Hydractinia symbiolongicarpus]